MSPNNSHTDVPLDWGTLPLAPNLELRITGDMPALPPDLDAAVETHWQRALTGCNLFNGRVFCAETITPGLLAGHWTEYRRIVAQMADPSLFPALRVRSVAVCGVLCCPAGIVVGRRQASSIYQAGLWQLPPAGSVDIGAATPTGASWRHALLAELREELGLTEADTTALTPICLVQHPTGVLDLGFRIDTPLTPAEIHTRHQTAGDGEYDQLRILPQPGLLEAIEAEGGRPVPAARLFLRHLPPPPHAQFSPTSHPAC